MSTNIHSAFLTLLMVTMVAVPKSGFAIGAIPVNSLYIVFALSLPVLLLKILSEKDALSRSPLSNVYMVLMLPFFVLFLLVTLFNGVDNPATYAGYLAALVVSPLYFFILFKAFPPSAIENILPALKVCIRIIAGYGITLFLYNASTGQFFEIPGITTTFGAVKTLDQRMNDRGDIFKLTSTYNNGNIYAVCALMLLPLYKVIEKQWLWFLVFVTSIILTLSRLAWALLFLYFIFEYFIFSQKLSFKKILIMVIFFAMLIPAVLFLLQIMGRDTDFIFDSNLGGRTRYLQTFFDLSVISASKLSWSYEIPYVSIAEFVGYIGIPFFLLYFLNIYINFKTLFRGQYPLVRASTLGCVLYFFATLIDGALILVPVFSIFSFLVMLSLSGIDYDYYARGRDYQRWCGHLPQQHGAVAG